MRAPAGDPDRAALQLALFDLGTLRVAVPSDNVVQAIALPPQRTRLPRSHKALEGVFLHRGQVVPLLDVQRWLEPDVALAEAATRQVLILRAGDRVIAILIDALKGLLQVPADAVRRIHHDDDAQEVFHSVVQPPGQASLISLLDPMRLAQLAQVWAVGTEAQSADGALGPSQHSSDAALVGGQTATCVVVRLGDTLLALPASAVGEIVGAAVVQKMAGMGGGFLGMGQWRGRDLPVLDMTLLLDLPDAPNRSAPWLLVLHLQERVLGFYVSEILAVRSFDAAGVQRGSVLSDAMQAYCHSSCLTQEGERVYLLEAQALLDASPLSNVLRQATTAAGQSGVLRLGHENGATKGALVVFRSRQLWAAPMDQMREILRLPSGLQTTLDAGSARRGSLEWRGQSLALLDLRMLRDAGPSELTDEARAIVTQAGEQTVALLVERVVALIPGHTGTRARFSANGKLVEMVTVGSGAEQVSYQLMDWRGLACWHGTEAPVA